LKKHTSVIDGWPLFGKPGYFNQGMAGSLNPNTSKKILKGDYGPGTGIITKLTI